MLCLVALLLVAVVADEGGSNIGYPPMQNPDLFEGDIIGVDGDINDRNAISNPNLRWPGGRVPYFIEPSLYHIRSLLTRAINDYHSKTCIKFVPRTTEADYITIFPGDGCYSNVGRVGGRQPLSLALGCHNVGIIIHELGHAIGFYHEQNRSDRDDYLEIFWNNIQKGMDSQFQKLLPHENSLYTPFDYNSIMLYGNYAFSKDGVSKTMVAKNGTPLKEPADKYGMTASDVQRVNSLYGCH